MASAGRAGGREELPPEERENVRKLLLQLAERVGSWDELMHQAGVPSTTHNVWRYGRKPVTPAAPTLLRLLRVAGVLDEDYLLVGEPPPGLSPAERLEWGKRGGRPA